MSNSDQASSTGTKVNHVISFLKKQRGELEGERRAEALSVHTASKEERKRERLWLRLGEELAARLGLD